MNVVILANCFAFEIKRSLLQHRAFTDVYDNVDIISTYLTNGLEDSKKKVISNADLIINQNPKGGHWACSENIKSIIKSTAIYIQTEFWRFNGFWPIKSPNERLNTFFWFPVDELKMELDFASYMNYPFDISMVQSNFDSSLGKLHEIDEKSDISMIDYVEGTFSSQRMFSDEWHPYPFFFQELSTRIVSKLGLETSCGSALPALGVNNDRYRLIPYSICEILGVDKSLYSEDFYYFSKKVTVEEYYYFSKLISDRNKLEEIKSQEQLRRIYYDFLGYN